MGIPAQVVKKKSCTCGEAASSAGFFFWQRSECRNSHVPKFAYTGKINSSMNHYIINFFLDFFKFRVILSNRCHQRVATQIPICLASEISEIPPTDQKLSMPQDFYPRPGPGAAPLGYLGQVSKKFPKNSTK
jgi:hypothetical protein